MAVGAMWRGITIDGAGARSVPAASTLPEDDMPCPTCPVIPRPPEQRTKGSETRMIRCSIHGIAFDSEREICPECAKPVPA